MTSPRHELFELLNRQIEDLLTEADECRLGELLSSDDTLLTDYSDFMSLHGQLFWDAGLSATTLKQPESVMTAELPTPVRQTSESIVGGHSSSRRATAIAATVAAVLIGWLVITQLPQQPNGNNVVKQPSSVSPTSVPGQPGAETVVSVVPQDTPELKPLNLPGMESPLNPSPRNTETNLAVADSPAAGNLLPEEFDNQTVIERIDRLLAKSWSEHDVQPSVVADDAEWIRRVYLTLKGRVPTLQETEQFLGRNGPRKRNALVADVMQSPELASHFAVVWTNLLVGRTQRPGVNREKLMEFLTAQFERNEPWIETVGELITATGRNDQNGATNFLLAHLNNEATPATAVTARLFLGEQVSCVQCHDHPFAKGLRQQSYWSLNAFFKDTNRVTASLADPSGNGSMAEVPWKLVDKPLEDRMTYYETRSALEKAVLPEYDGHTISRISDENRRQKLAELLAGDSEARVARAMVNRMWSHFFGYGFTNPIDDMGAHVTVSHPELLDVLTEAFVKSDYDLKRLMTWIAASNAWQLSSEATVAEVSEIDDPASGGTPLFSRVYVRRMTPEQVYESIRVAIRSAAGQPVEAGEVHSEHRRDWVRQFAQAYDTDENDESLNFEGSITQALVMMFGVEVDDAIHQATRAIIGDGRRSSISGTEALSRISLAMLTREPTSREKADFRKHHNLLTQQGAPGRPMATAVGDVMWAYLNSSEFVLVH